MMFGLKRRAAIALAAAGLIVLAGASTAAFAQTPTPTPGAQRTNYREVFVSKLASTLGIDQSKLVDAIKKAESDTIDQAVANGDLAKNRADDLKQRLNSATPGTLPFGGFGPFDGKDPRRGPVKPGPFGLKDQAVEQAIATKLGMTVQDLQTQLRSGKSLLDLAQAKGVSESDLRATIKTALKAELDKAVAEGKLTQAQEDAILSRVDSMPLNFGGKSPRPGAKLPRVTSS